MPRKSKIICFVVPQGVSRYLRRYEWSNAETNDLWQALSEVERAPPDVTFIMDTWTRQTGFPYVNLTFSRLDGSGDDDGDSTNVAATQSRFLAVPGARYNASDSPYGYKWYVSLDCKTSGGHKTRVVLNLTDASFDVRVNTDDSSSWVKCNKDQAGFYRVNYPPSNWRKIASMLRSTPIKDWPLSAADRSGLMNDAMSLARAGLLGYDVALEMTSYLQREDSFIPWQSTYESLYFISSMLVREPEYGLWQNFVLSVAVPSLTRLGYRDTGGHLTKRMRGMMIDLACRHGDPGCLSYITSSFRQWLNGSAELPANARSMVFKWGMWASSSPEADWDAVWSRYQRETIPQEKVNLLRALAFTRSPWLLARLLERALNGTDIRQQDFLLVVRMVATNPAARYELWAWVQTSWQQMVDKFSLFNRNLGQVVPAVVEVFNSPLEKEQVEAFFARFPQAGAGARARQQALENMDRNIYWMTHFKPTVIQWLRSRAADQS